MSELSSKLSQTCNKIEESVWAISIQSIQEKDSRHIYYNRIGTAFAITEKLLLTANHVIQNVSQNSMIILEKPPEDTTKIPARVLKSNPDADLALLEVIGETVLTPIGYIDDRIPSIGTLVVWGGFPTLVEERKNPPLRLRCARGIIASHEYSRGPGVFFEVDGTFNPGHSGSPVINVDSGKVIGVVSASAGGLNLFLERTRQRVIDLFNLTKIIEHGPGNMMFSELVAQAPKEEVERLLRRYKINVPVTEKPDGTVTFSISVSMPIAGALYSLQEMMQEFAIMINETFQMGLGIASGGKPLKQFIEEEKYRV